MHSHINSPNREEKEGNRTVSFRFLKEQYRVVPCSSNLLSLDLGDPGAAHGEVDDVAAAAQVLVVRRQRVQTKRSLHSSLIVKMPIFTFSHGNGTLPK